MLRYAKEVNGSRDRVAGVANGGRQRPRTHAPSGARRGLAARAGWQDPDPRRPDRRDARARRRLRRRRPVASSGRPHLRRRSALRLTASSTWRRWTRRRISSCSGESGRFLPGCILKKTMNGRGRSSSSRTTSIVASSARAGARRTRWARRLEHAGARLNCRHVRGRHGPDLRSPANRPSSDARSMAVQASAGRVRGASRGHGVPCRRSRTRTARGARRRRLEQLHPCGEPLLAGALRNRHLLESNRLAPGSRHRRHARQRSGQSVTCLRRLRAESATRRRAAVRPRARVSRCRSGTCCQDVLRDRADRLDGAPARPRCRRGSRSPVLRPVAGGAGPHRSSHSSAP